MNPRTPDSRYTMRHRAVAAGGTAAALALVPTAAQAHGLGDVTDRSVLDFVPLGIEHMLLGWDHLLFIAGVLLVSSNWRQAAKLITVFVIGHSLTLIIATLAGWQLNATFVDVIIGLSVVYVGVIALRGGTPQFKVFAGAVFGFGLVHGLGLSTRLQALGLPDEGLLARVIAFNVGIEIGQLTAIAVILGLFAAGRWLWSTRNRHLPQPVQLGAAALVLGGALAATLVVYQATVADDADAPAPVAQVVEAEVAAAACTEGARTEEFAGTGGHASKLFFEPTETTPMADFGHSLADGYVAYLYRPDLPAEQVAALREAVAQDPRSGILAGPVQGQDEAVKAVTATTTLACAEFDVDALSTFTNSWFESLG